MSRGVRSVLLGMLTLLSMTVSLLAGEVRIVGDSKIKENKLGELRLDGVVEKSAVLWRYDKALIDTRVGPKKNVLLWTAAPGTYTLEVYVFSTDKEGVPVIDEGSTTLTVEPRVPPPVPPVPPVPPGPNPPTPPGPNPPNPPPPSPAPIQGDGFQVLMVFDEVNKAKLPPKQLGVIYGAEVRKYLEDKCVTEPDGKTKAYRIWDINEQVAGDLPKWAEAMKRPRASVPWLIISNGKGGYEGPMPESPEKTLELLKKFGE